MPSSKDKPDVETTVALSDDDLKAITGDNLKPVVFDEDSATHQRPLSAKVAVAPVASAPDDETTHDMAAVKLAPPPPVVDDAPAAPPPVPAFNPPPLSRPRLEPDAFDLSPHALEPAENPTPLLRSRVEQPLEPDGGSAPSSALAPISRFPPPSEQLTPPRAPSPSAPATKPPSWVYGYLALCAALTLIGLIVLFFETQMLGST
jgi:hypothetical protein